MISNPITSPSAGRLRDRFGICQWFHFEDHAGLEHAVTRLRELGIRHLRTGISWADFYRPGGKIWYDTLMQTLGPEFEILLSVWHTPPSIAEGGVCSGPPRRLQDYADFIDLIITDYDSLFTHVELWNEPNNRYKWNFPACDPEWRKFGEMAGGAAYWAQRRGVPTVLGGMMPVDPHWLELMRNYGVLPYIDKIGIHGFPGMWWEGGVNWDWVHHWHGWEDKLEQLSPVSGGKPVWITESGLATWDLALCRPDKYDLQVQMLESAMAAPAERTYWYSLIDLDPARSAIEGFHVDENEYHMGLVTFDGQLKPAFHRLREALAEK